MKETTAEAAANVANAAKSVALGASGATATAGGVVAISQPAMFSLGELAMLVGIVTGIASLLVQWVYRLKELALRKREIEFKENHP